MSQISRAESRTIVLPDIYRQLNPKTSNWYYDLEERAEKEFDPADLSLGSIEEAKLRPISKNDLRVIASLGKSAVEDFVGEVNANPTPFSEAHVYADFDRIDARGDLNSPSPVVIKLKRVEEFFDERRRVLEIADRIYGRIHGEDLPHSKHKFGVKIGIANPRQRIRVEEALNPIVPGMIFLLPTVGEVVYREEDE